MKDKIENDFVSIQTKLAGVTFGDCQANIKKWGCADIGTYAVIREPDNPYDPNAVRVSFLGAYDMGYLPRQVAATLAPMMDAGRTFLAEFVKINELAEIASTVGVTIKIIETIKS